ncbi:T1SS-143 repeat domain-containing protein, partial [Rhizobium mesoamericanum]|uniref:T1SS-143 repeat domain-containing protein n=1 Tax=Rhizobium mesoamericanum TaxID=1079800 RepID=UPI00059258F3
MSIEDPRISAISSENVSHDFRQDIHEDASIEASAQQGVEVAQVENSQQPEKTDRLPEAPQTVAANAHPAEIVPDQHNVAHLPADVSIDDIRVEGNNLVLVQADGTEIVIVNGALHVPTFLLGEVELPQQAVIAALEQSNINVAAGPDGSYSASSGSPSSGGNFDTIQQPPHLPPLIADLLQNTDQPDGQPGRLFGGVGRHGQDATPPTSLAVPDGSPTVSLHVINLGNLAATLVLDESAGIQTSPDNDTALSDIADLFKGVSNQGFDGHMNGAQYATAGLLQADIQFGINGPAATNAVQWSLELGSGNDHDSGLKTTGGHEIYFFEENGLIVGRYDAENGEVTSADPAAFALAIDPVTGQLSMVQYVSIYNTDSNSQDEIDFIKSGQVLAKVTVSDFDGDKVDATVDIGDKIGFSDDGPILISVPAPAGDYSGSFFFDGFTSNGNAWNENSGVNNTGVSGNWHIAWADGSEGTPQLERVGDGYLGMHSSTNGYMIDLDASPGDVAVSQVLKLAEGESYTLTFEAGAAQAGSKHLVVTFGGVVVLEIDPPGQMTTYSISIVGGAGNASNTLEFKETGHADYYGTFLANVSVTGNSAILDDEDVGKAGNQGGTGDDGHGATAFGTIDFDAGSDGLGHIQVTGLESVAGLGNAALSVMYIDDTGKGTAEALGEGVWTPNGQGGSMSWSSLHVQNAIVVTVNADGTYSVTLNAALAHPATGTEDNLVLNFGFDIYDGDGDHVSGTISVNVDDDSPSINQQALQSATVAEDDIKTSLSQGTSPNDGNADGSYTGNASNSLPGPATVSGSIANVVNFGSDGKGGFSFTGDVSSLGALSSHGDALSYTVANGVLTATAGEGEGARVVFTLTLSNDGDYTFKLFDQLDHGTDATNGSVSIDFGGLIQATDGDGDSIPLTGGLKIAITDDAPTTAGRAHVSGTVEEEQLNGNEDTSGGSGSATDDDISHHGHFQDNTTAVVSGSGANSLATLVNTGADEGGHFSFSSELVGNAIETDGGASVKSGGSLVSVTSVAEGVDSNGHYQTITAGTTGEAAHDVFTLTVYDNGSWKFELKDNLDHSYGNNGEGVLKLDLSSLVQYTDFDNDSVTLDAKSFLVSVIDDVPVAAISASASKAPTLETQDHDTIGSGVGGTDTASADFSGAFKITSSYGADGAGTTNTTYALSLSGNSHHDDHDDWERGGFGDRVDSGLESNDHAIYLYEINGVIVGSTASSSHSVGLSNTIFTISVDGTGKVTLTQYDAIDHVGNGNGSVISLDEGLVKLTATVTITDHDGDKATDSASIDLGCNIKFDDDTPSITLTAGSDAALTLTTQDADTIDTKYSAKSDTASQNFAGAFTVGSSSYGADGAGNIIKTYALSVTGHLDSHNRVDSLLESHGQTIYLYKIGNTVYGSTSTSSNSSDVLQKAVFKIEVDNASTDAGTVKLTQYSAIDHGGDGTVVSLADNLVKLTATATITDGDGDQKSSNATIDLGGNIRFEDDGPSIDVTVKNQDVTVATQDSGTIGSSSDTATANFDLAFSFNASFGADGAATANPVIKSYSLDLTGNAQDGLVASGLASHGHQVYLYEVHGQIVGSTASNSHNISAANTIFAMSVNSATGEVTLTQYGAIDHGGNGSSISLASNLVSLTETVTITDYDGDKATDSAKIDLSGHITFTDATPTANATVAASLDDEGQPNGIDAGAGDLTGANSKSYSGTLAFTAGADGSKSIEITGLTVQNSAHQGNGDLQVLYVDGNGVAHAETVTFTWNSATNEYVGTSDHFGGADGGAAAVIVTVSQTGEYNIAINAPLAHPFTTEQNTAVAGSEYEDDLTLNFTYQVTDGDGDKASNTLSVTVDDDSPTMGGVSTIAVIGTGAQVSVTGTLDFHAGADGAGHANLAGNVAPENLVSDGETVHYWVSADGATLIAYTGANVDTGTKVFQLQIADDRKGYTFTEYATFGLQTTTTNTTTETFTKADGELDHANSPAASVNITTDNGATIVAVVSGSQEVNGSNGGFGLHSNNFDASDYLKFNFHQTVDSQPDPTTVTFSFTKNATVNYVVHYSDGTNVPVNNATVTAANGLTIPAHGNAMILDVEFYNIGDKTKIDLGSATVTTETKTTTVSTNTDLSFTAGLTDGDGDALSATINVHAVTNIPPTITVTPTGGVAGGHNLVDEAALSAGSHHAGSGSITTSGTLTVADANGNDDVQSVTISGHTFAVATLVGTTAATGQTVNGDHGTLTVYGYDSSTGVLSYSYTLTSSVTGPGNGTNIVTGGDSFAVSVADTSGTTSTANVVVDIKDDVPTARDVTVQSVAEGSVVTGTLDFVQGADGASVSKIGNVTLTFGNDGWSQSIAMEHGTLKVTADGHYQFTAQGADVYKDGGSSSSQVTVTDGDGDTSTAKVSFNVTDGSTDVTTASIAASNTPATVTEADGKIAFTITLSNASQGDTTVVTDHGTITIHDGQTTGTLLVDNPNHEDVYTDPSSLTVKITSVTGGGFESVVPDAANGSATAQITDTITPTTVSLTASTTTEGSNASYVF